MHPTFEAYWLALKEAVELEVALDRAAPIPHGTALTDRLDLLIRVSRWQRDRAEAMERQRLAVTVARADYMQHLREVIAAMEGSHAAD